MVKWIAAAVLLLPVLEIAAFVVVATLIGTLWALALMVLTSVIGVLVLRRSGRARLARFRVAVSDAGVAGIEANTGGFLAILGGILLLLPGFVTDVIGTLLLIPPVRRRCAAMFRRAMDHRTGRKPVIDLPPSEWSRLPDSPKKNASDPPSRKRQS